MPLRRSAVVSAVTLVLGVAVGTLGTWLSMRPADGRAPATATLAVERAATARPVDFASVTAGNGVDEGNALRAKIRASVTAALAEQRRGHDLDVFLDQLEATARRQGQVTAVEILTGLAAIDADSPDDPVRAPAFSRRMERLQRELGQVPPEPDAASARVSALSLVGDVRATPYGSARDALVRRSLVAIDHLPESEQDDARDALDRATAGGAPAPVAAATGPGLEGILAELRVTPEGKDRRRLVTQFIDAASALPLEEQEARFRQLDAATATALR